MAATDVLSNSITKIPIPGAVFSNTDVLIEDNRSNFLDYLERYVSSYLMPLQSFNIYRINVLDVTFIAENDKVSKKKTKEYLEFVGKNIDKQMILIGEDNALKKFLYNGFENPHGMQNGRHHDGDEMHWYVPPRVKH